MDMKAITQAGQVHEKTGRVAITLAQERNRPDPDMPAYLHDPEAEAAGLECWKLIDGIDHHVSGGRVDVWFEDGGMTTLPESTCIYITKREFAQVLQGQKKGRVQLAVARKNRVYVAGPMTGIPGHNFPAFNAAADALRAEGWHVENPADHGVVNGVTWADYMHADVCMLASCGAIYLLPGWSESRGASLEAHIAAALGMQFLYADGAEQPLPVAVHLAVAEVLRELRRAMAKFPTWPTDPLHAIAVVNEEVGELNKELLQLTYEPHKVKPEGVHTEAVQSAAMALRFLASLARYEFRECVQHSQAVAMGGGL